MREQFSAPQGAAGSEGAPAFPDRVRHAPVTDRVNAEPAILNGMSSSEAYWIGVLSMAVNLLIAGMILAITGLWQLMLLIPLMGTAAILWCASLYLQKVKRGRPEAYYTQAIHLWMAQRGLTRSRFLRHQGYWSLGRSLGFSLVSPLDPAPQEACEVGPIAARAEPQ